MKKKDPRFSMISLKKVFLYGTNKSPKNYKNLFHCDIEIIFWKRWLTQQKKDVCCVFRRCFSREFIKRVAYLHGYRVQQSLSGTKKHAFEIIPPDPSKKHYYFQTETDADRKRWIAALEYSIDRWLKVT
ncbi:unnamed protein product [Acanthoscelides obtectus]|uniref:PH domain-containing protein n=1 Tax=Acanthoscelides obtectus TaxID=200917 RepID=A0A9P0L0X5_ACAOB|nr:unnamed protein product [Acanthoscelides obtectus]CAK1674972.1 hypothetical protein AOBTE_LOCUS29836 [Acanthoscelides obtectus]